MRFLLLAALLCALAPAAPAQSPEVAAELDYAFETLDLSETASGILANRRPLLVDPGLYDGTPGDVQIQATQWKALHYQLRNSALDASGIPTLAALDLAAAHERAAGRLPLALMYRPYDYLAQADLDDGTFLRTSNDQIQVSAQARQAANTGARAAPLYRRSEAFAGTVYHHILEEEIYAGGAVVGQPATFRLPSSLFLVAAGTVTNLQIDLGDGSGLRPLTVGSNVVTTYASAGRKLIRILATIDGSLYETITSILVLDINVGVSSDCARTATDPVSQEVVCDVTPRPGLAFDPIHEDGIPLRFLGNRTARYDYAVYLAPGRSVLTRPVLVLDGIDPGEARVNVSGIYSVNVDILGFDYVTNSVLGSEFGVFSQSNIFHRLRESGYDIVVLTYDQSKDYIQRNGRAVVDLIERLDARLATNGAVGRGGSSKVETVIGFSMGGVVGRYALAYMESSGYRASRPAHGVKLFVSYDSPQQGANIPVSAQIFLHDIVRNLFTSGAVAFTSVEDEIHAPAVQQLLTYWAYDGGLSVTTAQATSNPLRVELYDNLRALGDYPQLPRRVAVTNGATNGNAQRVRGTSGAAMAPGTQQLFVEGGAGVLWGAISGRLRFRLYAANNTSGTNVYQRETRNCFIFCNTRERRVPLQTPAGYDSAPGGFTNAFPRLRTDINTAYDLGILGALAYLSPLGIYAEAEVIDFVDGFSFVPSVSATDYNATSQTRAAFLLSRFSGQNYTAQIDFSATARTPFHRLLTTASSISTGTSETNRRHLTLTSAVASELLSEIQTASPAPPAAPLTASISGPYSLPYSQQGTWTAVVSGSGAGPTGHHWDYSNTSCGGIDPELTAEPQSVELQSADAAFSPEPGGDGPPTTNGLPCGEWYPAGDGRVLTRSFNPTYFQLRLTVTRGNETAITTRTISQASGARAAASVAPEDADAARFAAGASQTALPLSYALRPPAPNPSPGRTLFRYDLPEASDVRLVVVDVLGREVARVVDARVEAGTHEAAFDGSRLPAGLYVARFRAGTFAATQTLTLAR